VNPVAVQQQTAPSPVVARHMPANPQSNLEVANYGYGTSNRPIPQEKGLSEKQ